MNKLLIYLTGVLAIFGALVVGGYHFFGIGGAVGGLVLFIVAIKALIGLVKRRFVQLGKALFDSKSRVMRGATAVVHGISVAPAPEGRENLKRDTNFYFLDVTIQAPSTDGSTPFSCWDPTELMVIPFDAAAPDINADEADDTPEYNCEVHDVSWVEEQKDACSENGAQRFKLHVEVPGETKRFKFQYYFETFGDVVVP